MSSVKLHLGCCWRNFGNDKNQWTRIDFEILTLNLITDLSSL